jgi:hypothetical protein
VGLVVGLAVTLAVAVAVGLGDAAATLALGDGATLVVGAATVAVWVGVGDPALTASCVERRPAIASPTASTATSANGDSAKAVRTRRMARRYGFFVTVTTA